MSDILSETFEQCELEFDILHEYFLCQNQHFLPCDLDIGILNFLFKTLTLLNASLSFDILHEFSFRQNLSVSANNFNLVT